VTGKGEFRELTKLHSTHTKRDNQKNVKQQENQNQKLNSKKVLSGSKENDNNDKTRLICGRGSALFRVQGLNLFAT